MQTLLPSLSVVLLALLVGTLPGCAVSPPLVDAARRGDTQTVRTLLDQGMTADMTYALINAACYDHREVVQLLLERGAGVNDVVGSGWSALQCAAYYGHPEMVSLLLKSGANREYKGGSDITALGIAKQQGHASVVQILEDAPATPAATPPKRPAPTPSAESPPPPPIY